MTYGSDSRGEILDGDIAAAKRICCLAHDLKSTNNNIDDLTFIDYCALIEGRSGGRLGEVGSI